MPQLIEKPTIATFRIRIRPDAKFLFVDWQATLNKSIAACPGFSSIEMLSPRLNEWLIVQRFNSFESLEIWQKSAARTLLVNTLKTMVVENGIEELSSDSANSQSCVTEIFVTEVTKDKQGEYHEWMSKIHEVEPKFAGFKGMYVQAPSGNGRNWITLLQFDTQKNLDHWLISPERQNILSTSSSFIKSLENHRVISPYAGWFASIARAGEMPPVWKQTMLVLLVLFPIVMLELKYLNPLLASLNSSTATFIGNAISVSLISWPMMPLAIWLLSWWLAPLSPKRGLVTTVGVVVVLVLYVFEIVLFWDLL